LFFLLFKRKKKTIISAPTEQQKIIQKYLSKKGSMCVNLARSSADNLGLEVKVVVTKINFAKKGVTVMFFFCLLSLFIFFLYLNFYYTKKSRAKYIFLLWLLFHSCSFSK